MGHLIEDDIIKRADFNDERFLYEMAILLEKHPLNGNKNLPREIRVPCTGTSSKYITIENKEINDPITVTITGEACAADIISAKSNRTLPKEIDITKMINS